jgi:hypothetical protein
MAELGKLETEVFIVKKDRLSPCSGGGDGRGKITHCRATGAVKNEVLKREEEV